MRGGYWKVIELVSNRRYRRPVDIFSTVWNERRRFEKYFFVVLSQLPGCSVHILHRIGKGGRWRTARS
jgi:hypothetical protein